MIYVDDLQPRQGPWPGGWAAHLVSDSSREELRSFAASIGLHVYWLWDRPYPHFEVSPKWYRKARAAGAIRVDRRGLLAALARLRAADPVFPW